MQQLCSWIQARLRTTQNAMPALDQAEIGQKLALPAQIETSERAIHANPVDNFDLTRVVKVFAAYIQFYEFEIRGAQIQNQSVTLPKSLIASIRDKSTRDRITAEFKLVGADSKVSGERVRKKAAAIRKRFIRHHPTYGGIILKSARAELEAQIAELEKLIEIHKQTVMSHFDTEAKNSIEKLVKAFWREIFRRPPQELIDQLGREKPATEEAKTYLRHVLTEAFPNATEMIEGMRLTRVVKDVTWNTLNEPGFIDWLKKQFPMRKDLQQPFELYRAVREAEKSRAVRVRD
jgi:F0F1-type ATP synthase membrane subunit b/b'